MNWAEVWQRRSALLYTVGAWTAFGSVFYFSSGFLDKPKEDEEDLSGKPTGLTISEDGLKETTTYRPEGKGFIFVSTATYKPNFVPLSTRLQNYVQSFFGGKEK